MSVREQEDHDLLIGIDARLKNMEKMFTAVQAQCDNRVKSITNEIDALKQWKNKTMGAFAVLGGGLALVLGVIAWIFSYLDGGR